MIRARVVHSDGRDEVYDGVVKIIEAMDKLLIYTKDQTFTIYTDEVLFTQFWDQGSE